MKRKIINLVLRIVSTIASLELISIARNYFVVENHRLFESSYASMRGANAMDSIFNVISFVVICVGLYLLIDGAAQLYKKF